MANKENLTRIGYEVPPDIKSEAIKLAKKDGLTLSAWARLHLIKTIEKEKVKTAE